MFSFCFIFFPLTFNFFLARPLWLLLEWPECIERPPTRKFIILFSPESLEAREIASGVFKLVSWSTPQNLNWTGKSVCCAKNDFMWQRMRAFSCSISFSLALAPIILEWEASGKAFGVYISFLLFGVSGASIALSFRISLMMVTIISIAWYIFRALVINIRTVSTV